MRAFCIVLAIALCRFPAVAFADDTHAQPSTAALRMAHVVGPPTLVKLTVLGIHNTVTYRMLMTHLGPDKTEQVIRMAVKAHFAEYAPRWEAVNAAAYAGLLTEGEMDDVASGSPSLAAQQKFSSVAGDAGDYIRQNGQKIVVDYVAAVLKDGFKAMDAAKEQPADPHKAP